MAILAQGCKSAAVEETCVSSSPPAQFPLSNCAQCVAITGFGVEGSQRRCRWCFSFNSSSVPKLEVTGDLSRVGKAYERIAVLSTTQSLNMYSTIDEELGKSLCV